LICRVYRTGGKEQDTNLIRHKRMMIPYVRKLFGKKCLWLERALRSNHLRGRIEQAKTIMRGESER
jgi:hypothetical protein